MMTRFIIAILIFTLAVCHPPAGAQTPALGELPKLKSQLQDLYRQGNYAAAIPVAEKILSITKQFYGPDSVETATSLSDQANLYYVTGRYAEAESLFKRCLEIRESKLGQDDPKVAASLNNLASLYYDTGRYAQAEPLYQRSLKIRETKLGQDHPDVSASLNNLAGLYSETGRYAEAEPLYKRSLKIMEVKFGQDDPKVAASLNNLAGLYKVTGRSAEAEPLYQRSLKIRETLGLDHPDVATALNNLATLYYDTGRYVQAEPLYQRSLKILEAKLGQDHPNVAQSLANLALLYGATKKFNLSHQFLSRTLTIHTKTRENVFLMLDEPQKRSYIVAQQDSLEAFLSLTARYLPGDHQAVQDALNAWLRWKGTVAESQSRLIEACSRSHDPLIKSKCQELTDTRRNLASLSASKPENMAADTYRQTLEQLAGRTSALEAELSRLSRDFALEKLVGQADIPAISALLPKDSVYLDFAVVRPYDFKGRKFEDQPRCLAFILLPGEQPRVLLQDLGSVTAIDRRIRDYHEVIRAAVSRRRPPDEAALQVQLRALHLLVMAPLLPHLQGRTRLFISPDGSLNLIPFEAFLTPQGKYLLEDFSIHYVAAGRDLLRLKDTAVALGRALILADPDYDLGQQARLVVPKRLGRTNLEVRGAASRDASMLSYFTRIPGAEQEAAGIRQVMLARGPVQCYLDKEAIQEVLFQAASPRFLHIATHGYFFPDQQTALQWRPGRDRLPPEAVAAYENPMRRSGIALAGANTSLRQRGDYGLVSAEKLQGLNLKGTDLVVLSACETGVGDVQNGEGVFGLKRAFILSGARTVVMSLWKVPSQETTQLMQSFYKLLSQGRPKAQALREAKQALKQRNSNPFFWAPFVMVGDPGEQEKSP